MGLYLAEVFNVIYQGHEEVKPEKQIGTIKVDDGRRCHYLYSVDCVDATRPSIQPGDQVILSGPTVAISCNGPLCIDFDMFGGDYKDSIYFEYYPSNGLMQNAPREKRILSSDGTGEIVVLYALFDNAMEANLEIKLITNDNSDVSNIHGVVAATISDFDQAAFSSMLFLKKPDYGIDMAHGDLILPLSRSIIAVAFKSSLFLEFHLLSNKEEFVHDFVEFHAQPSFESVGCLSSKKGDIIIEITWACLPRFVEGVSDCEIIGNHSDGCKSESDSDCETIASLTDGSKSDLV